MKKSDSLREIIKNDASKLEFRQETDTIDIIDELRYAINEVHASYSSKKELKLPSKSIQVIVDRDQKLYILDEILEELGLEC